MPVASGNGEEGALEINENVTIYLSSLERSRALKYQQREDRRTHIYLISGNLEIACSDGVFQLQPGDAARIRKSCDLNLKGTGSDSNAEFVLIDLP
ncbi:hypothetical protein D3C79_965230 [compost metagenome]